MEQTYGTNIFFKENDYIKSDYNTYMLTKDATIFRDSYKVSEKDNFISEYKKDANSTFSLIDVDNNIIQVATTSNEINTIKNLFKTEEEEETTENLYLTSNKYKIENKYISRIERKITKEEFIKKLQTNGTIKILKEDGTELKENELVGTGMTLEVIKEEEEIQLKVAVIGDLSGDGKVTAQDLSTINKAILEILTLEDEYKIAADLDENDKLTATDLSTVNKMVLEIL